MIYWYHMWILILTFLVVLVMAAIHPYFAGTVAMAIVGLHWVAIAGYKSKIKKLERLVKKIRLEALLRKIK